MVNKFVEQPFFEKLGARKDGFKFIVEHLCKQEGPTYIIETGTARIKDNWNGDGQSTLIWDWCIDNQGSEQDLCAYSIDLKQEYVDIAKQQTKNVRYICGDSLKALSEMDPAILKQTKLLYLDSFDWSPDMHMESAFHHMCEFATVWSSLPEGCLVVVDDCHSVQQGKHVMVQYYFAKLSKLPAFSGYQTAWLK